MIYINDAYTSKLPSHFVEPAKSPVGLYDFNFEIKSHVKCAKTEIEHIYIGKTKNTKKLVLDMKCIKLVFYRQQEHFVVNISNVSINSLILFYFQWK